MEPIVLSSQPQTVTGANRTAALPSIGVDDTGWKPISTTMTMPLEDSQRMDIYKAV
jgi:hypothetical protein